MCIGTLRRSRCGQFYTGVDVYFASVVLLYFSIFE